MAEADDGRTELIPRGRNALSGAAAVYEGLAIAFMGLVLKALAWDQEGSTLIMGIMVLAGIGLVLYGSVLVVRYDDDGNLRHPREAEATPGTPPGYYVRESAEGTAAEYAPTVPDPGATPRGGPPSPGPTFTYPPPSGPRDEPGKCPDCGGRLFAGRPNCPHCGGPVRSVAMDRP
jgi:hypothetical protein